MPFTHIALRKGKSPEFLHALSDAVHQALVEAFEVPADDRFQMITQLDADTLIYDRHYQGGPRSDDFIVVRVTAGRQRAQAVKDNFFKRLADLIHERTGVQQADVMTVIVCTGPEDWSFGHGVRGVVRNPHQEA
ncbi:MAG TPA: tautomerase family protein [Telluria sp.]|nr:tautomerase family protein [Telluria sp.]